MFTCVLTSINKRIWMNEWLYSKRCLEYYIFLVCLICSTSSHAAKLDFETNRVITLINRLKIYVKILTGGDLHNWLTHRPDPLSRHFCCVVTYGQRSVRGSESASGSDDTAHTSHQAWASIDRRVVVGGLGVVIIRRRQRAQHLVQVAVNKPELFICPHCAVLSWWRPMRTSINALVHSRQ